MLLQSGVGSACLGAMRAMHVGARALCGALPPPTFSVDGARAQWEPKWWPTAEGSAQNAADACERVAAESRVPQLPPRAWAPHSA